MKIDNIRSSTTNEDNRVGHIIKSAIFRLDNSNNNRIVIKRICWLSCERNFIYWRWFKTIKGHPNYIKILIIIGVWKCESLIARCWDKIVCIKKFHLDCICPILQAPNILERVNSTSAVVFIISIHTKNSFILMLFLNYAIL